MESINDKNPKDLFYIDVDKIVRSQQSRMVRNLPQFIINAIKKIVRQDEINRQLDLMRDRNDIDFIKAHVEYLNVTVKGWNIENLPESGRFIFVCNHPLGAVDFYAALMITREKFPVVKALANDILLNFENLRTLFLPVNAFGRSSVSYHKMMQEAYASSIQIMTFPAGEVSRKRHGEIKDGPWHRSFVRNAIEFQRNVIPVYIHARNSRRFYRISRIRQLLGIKLNLELLLLPDEMFKQRDKTIHVVIGEPIPYQQFDDSKSHYEWSQLVKERVYSLRSVIKS